MNRLFFNHRREFRILGPFVFCVVFHGVAANLHPPVLEVIWDMVFYKGLAHGLHCISTFDLHRHFPMPPLYPLLISPAFFAGDCLTVAFIQSWINPFLYFLGLYPTYYYARRLMGPKESAFACVLYALYPSAIYSQWTMSENLAAPLVVWVLALSVKLLTDERPRMKDGTWLGIAVACVALTRIFLIVFCVTVLVWVFYRTVRKRLYPAPIWMATSLSFSISISVWWLLGYFSNKGTPLIYADFNQLPLKEIAPLFGTILSAHWIGLWIEGALAFVPLVVVQGALLFLSRSSKNSPLQETARLVFCLYLAMTAAVAGYYVKRFGIEPWSISLRYIFYANLACIPLVVSSFGALSSVGWKKSMGYLSLLIACAALLGFGVRAPEIWMKLRENHAFFSNAPALDFIYQIRNEGSSTVAWILISISMALTVCCLFFRRTGFTLVCGLLLFLQLSGLGHVQYVRENAIENLHVLEIHNFCRELELGKWKKIQLYCEEDVSNTHLIPNLFYWVQYPSGSLSPSAPRPIVPYLLLTLQKHDDGELVFESGDLRAYLFN